MRIKQDSFDKTIFYFEKTEAEKQMEQEQEEIQEMLFLAQTDILQTQLEKEALEERLFNLEAEFLAFKEGLTNE